MSGLLNMGGYAEFVWTAYGVSALLLGAAIFLTWRAYARARAEHRVVEAAIKRTAYAAPVAAFVGLAWILFNSLNGHPTNNMASVLLGRPVPTLKMPPLDAQAQGFGPADLAVKGSVTIVNVFASWCVPCREEVPQLAQLGQARGVRLIGMVYKDKPAAARAFLDDYGNPYQRIGLDADGRAAIEWGIYGVPETFVIDGHGVIRGRFGPLTPDNLVLELLPAIASASLTR